MTLAFDSLVGFKLPIQLFLQFSNQQEVRVLCRLKDCCLLRIASSMKLEEENKNLCDERVKLTSVMLSGNARKGIKKTMKNERNQLLILDQSAVRNKEKAKMNPASIMTFVVSLQTHEALVNCKAARSAKNEKSKPDSFLEKTRNRMETQWIWLISSCDRAKVA